jgi:hypothetical protein
MHTGRIVLFRSFIGNPSIRFFPPFPQSSLTSLVASTSVPGEPLAIFAPVNAFIHHRWHVTLGLTQRRIYRRPGGKEFRPFAVLIYTFLLFSKTEEYRKKSLRKTRFSQEANTLEEIQLLIEMVSVSAVMGHQNISALTVKVIDQPGQTSKRRLQKVWCSRFSYPWEIGLTQRLGLRYRLPSDDDLSLVTLNRNCIQARRLAVETE